MRLGFCCRCLQGLRSTFYSVEKQQAMALVDYSSSASENEDSASDLDRHLPSTSKRLKTNVRKSSNSSGSQTSGDVNVNLNSSNVDADNDVAARGAKTSAMPPLPTAFHDLYASTVRQSVVDDPTLHHGRKRQVPHVVGKWPSHLYVEWHPTTSQHNLLTELIRDIENLVSSEVKLYNFLTSDLGSPLPLHISLSRPLSLNTRNKDEFSDAITHSIISSGVGPFTVHPQGLAWFRSPDSNRTFLILRVASGTSTTMPADGGLASPHLNPELMALLNLSNNVATRFEQPILYQKDTSELVGSAFHVSIGWTFDLPNDELSLKTLRLFKQRKFEAIRDWDINVSGIKAKVGNAVNHITLRTSRKGTRSSDISL